MQGYPGAIIAPSPNFRQGRRAAIDAVVFHTTESHSLDNSLQTLTDPYRQLPNEQTGVMESARVSAHYLVDDSGIYQLVSDDDEAWTVGVHNRHTINIEVVGEADDPTTWTAATVRNLARLVAWLSTEYSLPLVYRETASEPEVRGFVSHGALDPARRHDPGIWFPWGEVKGQAQQIINGADPATVGRPDIAPLVGILLIALGIAWSLAR